MNPLLPDDWPPTCDPTQMHVHWETTESSQLKPDRWRLLKPFVQFSAQVHTSKLSEQRGCDATWKQSSWAFMKAPWIYLFLFIYERINQTHQLFLLFGRITIETQVALQEHFLGIIRNKCWTLDYVAVCLSASKTLCCKKKSCSGFHRKQRVGERM